MSDFSRKLEQKQFFGVFLKKSSIPFILFNSIIYLGTLLQFTIHLFSNFIDFETDTTTLITIVFNSILSFVLFSTQVSLLTIGVEIYFKIQGAFRYEDQINKPLFQQLLRRNRQNSCSEIYPLDGKNLDNFTNSSDFKSTPLKIKSRRVHSHTDINFRYALAARLGVCLQGFFSLLLSLFIVSDIMRDQWIKTVDTNHQSVYIVSQTVVEFLVMVWFPSFLWNSISPKNLWLLNPRLLLKNVATYSENEQVQVTTRKSTSISKGSSETCYICCDGGNKSRIVNPCLCKGGLNSVHHDCLKLWILNTINAKDSGYEVVDPTAYGENTTAIIPKNKKKKVIRCKVCNYPYKISQTTVDFMDAVKVVNWKLVVPVMIVAGVMPYVAFLGFGMLDRSKILKIVTTGCAIIFEYGCLKLLGFNLVKVYIAAQQGAIRILNIDE